jgi:hypothetical protein
MAQACLRFRISDRLLGAPSTRRRGLQVLLLAAAIAGPGRPALALDVWIPFESRLDREDPERRSASLASVLERPRPDYSALGFDPAALGGLFRGEIGKPSATDESSGFLLFPNLKLEGQRSDNIFRADTVKRSDTIGLVTPSAVLTSDWSRHSFTLLADGTFARYASTSAEDYEDYHVVANGRLDVSEDLQTFLRLVKMSEHEERGGIDNPGAINARLATLTSGAALGAIYEVEGIALSPRLQYRHISYGLANGGVDTTDAAASNHDEYLFDSRVSYEIVPGTRVFIQPSANRRSYAVPAPGQLGLSSSGYEMLAGAVWNVSSVTLIDAGVGYLSQQYDDARVLSVEGPGANILFVWNPLDALTVTAAVQRRVDATNAINFSSVLLTNGRLGVDVEVLENVILGSELRYYEANYKGGLSGTPGRIDDVRIGSVSARYLVSDHVDFGLSYRYTERTSNQPNLGYVENLFMVQANLKW